MKSRIKWTLIKIMTGPFHPSNALNNLTCNTNISDFLKAEADKEAVRLQSYNNWKAQTAYSGKGLIKAYGTISNDFLNDLNLPHTNLWDALKPSLVLDRKFDVIKPGINNIDNYKTATRMN